MTPLAILALCFICFIVGMYVGGMVYAVAINEELDHGIARCGGNVYRCTKLTPRYDVE